MTGRVEGFLKSTTFSLVCFAVWIAIGIPRIRGLVHSFSWMELVWVAYHSLIAILFLIRARPSRVSLRPAHWLVALVTSFSGFFFLREPSSGMTANQVGDAIILVSIVGSGMAGLALWRSYDFLPALRGVSTGLVYRFVRHPMYVFSILNRLGYVIKHPGFFNTSIFLVLIGLYVLRAKFEEEIMRGDPLYVSYAERVRFRFLPGIY